MPSLPSWLHRTLRLLFDSYQLRVSCGLIASLLLVLGLLHLPKYPDSRVGWGYRSTYESIPLSALQEEADEKEETNEDKNAEEERSKEITRGPASEAPIPTQHETVESASPTAEDTDGTDANSENPTTAQASSSDSTRRPVQMAVLSQGERPEIVGGEGSLYLNIKYPEAARQEGIQGKLILGFTVTKEGEPRDIHVLKSLHPACDSAAIEALRSVQFVPGKQNGNPVAVHMRLPIRFRLLPGLEAANSSS